ncbi:MAG: HAD family phosphatase [Prolixibacteraceae bacterium]|jgi:HAD superfamily hydrolase (TIGR01509 family)
MIAAIIFDMDGVLVDSEPFHEEIEKRQFSLNNLTITREEHSKYLGVATDAMWMDIKERHHLSLPVEELIEQNRNESYRLFAELNEIPTIPGIANLLEKLSAKNYLMAVASSNFPEIIELMLEKTGMRKYFKFVVSTQEAGKSKPAPDVYLLAAQKLGVKPENCLVVEDSQNGIKAAKSAGMIVVAYQGPFTNPQSQREADSVITQYNQLEMILF